MRSWSEPHLAQYFEYEMDRRLVDHFVNADLISRAGMQRFILRATKNKTGVVEEILADGSLDEQVVAEGLAGCYGYELLPNAAFDADPTAINMITGKMAKAHGVLPYAVNDDGDEVTVAIYDTENADEVLKTLKMATGNKAEVKVAPRSLLEDAIDHYYFDEPWPLKEEADQAKEAEAADEEEAPEFELEKIEESDEFLLEDLVEDLDEIELPEPDAEPEHESSKKSARKKAPARRPETRKKPFAKVEPKKIAKPRAPKPPQKEERKKQDSVEQALEDFDDFLDQSNYVSGAPGVNDDSMPQNPEWDADDHMAAQSGFDVGPGFDAGNVSDDDFDDSDGGFDDDAFANAFNDEPDGGGFDLFEPSEVQMPIEDLVARNEKRIQSLKRELKGQREVVSSLVDLLVESRVISRKELMQRVNEKRKG